jgi:hypothetical protein
LATECRQAAPLDGLDRTDALADDPGHVVQTEISEQTQKEDDLLIRGEPADELPHPPRSQFGERIGLRVAGGSAFLDDLGCDGRNWSAISMAPVRRLRHPLWPVSEEIEDSTACGVSQRGVREVERGVTFNHPVGYTSISTAAQTMQDRASPTWRLPDTKGLSTAPVEWERPMIDFLDEALADH